MAKRHKSVFAPCRRHLRAPTRLSRDVRPAAYGLAPLPDSGGLQAAGRDSQAQRWRLGGHCWAVWSHRQLGKTCGHWVGSRGFPRPGFPGPCRQSTGSGFRPSLLLVPWAAALGAIPRTSTPSLQVILLLLDWVPPPLRPPELSFCKLLICSHHSLTCISHPARSASGQVLGSSLHSGPGEPELSVFPASLTTALSREKDTLRAVVSRASPAAGRRNHGCLHSWARRV